MVFSQQVKDLIYNAHPDGCICLVGTTGPRGPNIAPKGSMMVYDDNHLAYWERSKTGGLDNLRNDPRVCVFYSNMNAFRAGELGYLGGMLRFYGEAELHEDGEIRDKIFAMLPEREQSHKGADQGLGVLIKLYAAIDMRGDAIN